MNKGPFNSQGDNFLLMLLHTCNRSFAQMCLLIGTVSRVSDVVHVSLVCVCVWAVNGDWTNWSEWTPCDVTCGTGLQTRRRNCSNPEPAFGGKICPGYKTEARNCQPRYCQSMYLLNEFSFCSFHWRTKVSPCFYRQRCQYITICWFSWRRLVFLGLVLMLHLLWHGLENKRPHLYRPPTITRRKHLCWRLS